MMQTTVREFLSQYRVRPMPQLVPVRRYRRPVSAAAYDQIVREMTALYPGNVTEWVADR